MTNLESWLTEPRVAEILGVPPKQVRRWIKSGVLPAVRLAGVRALPYRIHREDLALVLQPARPVDPRDAPKGAS